MKTVPQKISIVFFLLVIWLIVCGILVYRINTYGAFASLCSAKTLEYIEKVGKAQPGSIRLNQSYSQWALALNLTDPSNYIKTGLGFAEGKGISQKNISPEDPNSKNYLAYYFQAPGTPAVIGTMIKIFGEKSVVPYFILISTLHFITALLVCVLASRFIEGSAYIFGVGLLSLLCLPALDYNFDSGLFSSEPLVAPFVVASLIALSDFWSSIRGKSPSYKHTCLTALGFGSALGCASYFRDVYATFACFCFIGLVLSGIIQRKRFKHILLFVLIGSIVVAAIQYPWEKRNQKYLGEFTMAGSSYCGFSRWHQIWDDYRESSKWSWDAGVGLGNYLAPEKSKEVLDLLDKDKQAGNKYAWRCYIEAICRKPWQAITYKLGVYDTLWFGQRSHWYIYAWCLLSTLCFFTFLWLTRFRFVPELWLFPLFLLCISPFMHYEHRYAQPFFFFITPITVMCVIKYWREKVT